jgi:plasmid stabilization system protein ParE
VSRPVVTSQRADADIEAIGRWWAVYRSSEQAKRWVDGILKVVERLALDAERHAKAAENDAFPIEMRQVNFGLGRRPSHRVLFTIRPDCVYVLAVLHVSQDAIGLDDI